jgi:hypothetical protein
MVQELSQELIQFLVEIGESERFDDCEQILTRFPHLRSGAFMRLRPQPWHEVAVSLDDSRLIAIIKTLTVIEGRLPGFASGSVSPVIFLMHTLSKRSPGVVPATVDWVLSHSDNSYLPFGRSNHGAKCFAELRNPWKGGRFYTVEDF